MRSEKSALKRLIVTPLLSKDQIGAISIDLRLANQFIVFRMHAASAFNQRTVTRNDLHRLQHRQIVRYDEKFVLHPGTLALGCTIEYLKIPADVEGQIEGRSSWARVGLQIATATSIEPDFHGAITLELSNVGTVPLELYPGIRIAQLVLRQVDEVIERDKTKKRKYQYAIGTEFSRLDQDEDKGVFVSHSLPNPD